MEGMTRGDYCWWERGPFLCVRRGARRVGVARAQEGEACFVSAPLTGYPDPLSELSPADLLYPVFPRSREGSLLICASVFLSMKWIQEPISCSEG